MDLRIVSKRVDGLQRTEFFGLFTWDDRCWYSHFDAVDGDEAVQESNVKEKMLDEINWAVQNSGPGHWWANRFDPTPADQIDSYTQKYIDSGFTRRYDLE
jgi:hypothetical protein